MLDSDAIQVSRAVCERARAMYYKSNASLCDTVMCEPSVIPVVIA